MRFVNSHTDFALNWSIVEFLTHLVSPVKTLW